MRAHLTASGKELVTLEMGVERVAVADIHGPGVLHRLIAVRIRHAACEEHGAADGDLQALRDLRDGQTRLDLLLGLDERHAVARLEQAVERLMLEILFDQLLASLERELRQLDGEWLGIRQPQALQHEDLLARLDAQPRAGLLLRVLPPRLQYFSPALLHPR